MTTKLKRLTEAEARENMRGAYDEHGRYVEHISERKAQPPATPPQACEDWQTVERLELAKEIRQLQQERDQARDQLKKAAGGWNINKIEALVARNSDLRAQVADLVAALRETLDALYNETHGKLDSYWIHSAKKKANAALDKADATAAIARAEKGQS